MAKRSVVATVALGCWAFAQGTLMPDGRDYPEECIMRLEEGHRVESLAEAGDVLVKPSGERVELPPCNRSAHADAGSPLLGRVNYFSSWVVDTVSVHDSITMMESTWTVPKAPESRGPVPGMSSAYLFNGLENGAGVRGKATMILQPVLSHGKSGCVFSPLAGWVFTAFQVTAAGRAYCGPNVGVQEGDQLVGRMEKVSDGEWTVTADAGKRGKSVHQAKVDFNANAAYITLEAMVVYNCKALPASAATFTGNKLQTASGEQLAPSWRTEVRRPECQAAADVRSNGDVELSWQTGSQDLASPVVV
eukprot:gb/GFBE01078747.1/.p1 GENE.gb/GFBE01078747.1/~~gb/GFBE01078747.1/.p1  ORF type:complete len:305 (+),score=54.50 gb/GFBE01078747.1/:1-915(+)